MFKMALYCLALPIGWFGGVLYYNFISKDIISFIVMLVLAISLLLVARGINGKD